MRFLVGLAAAYALFELLARSLGSDRGQAGVMVCAGVIAALVIVEHWLSGQALPVILRHLGLGRPAWKSVLVALLPSAVLLAVLLAYLALTPNRWTLLPAWPLLLFGMFFQGGVAEEALFRGYLYRHLREGRTFRQATRLARIPFVLLHLPLFLIVPWAVALASVVVAAILTAPLAHLFELGGRTLWAPALLHFVVQAAIKIVVVEEATPTLPMLWLATAAVAPYLVFRWRVERADGGLLDSRSNP